MHTLHVELGERSYPIYIGRDLLADGQLLAPHVPGSQVVIVSNETVAPLYVDRVRAALGERALVSEVVLRDGEQYKTLDSLTQIFDRVMADGHNRTTTFVAVGGGVVGDVTGFAAACYQRGVNFVQVPTTIDIDTLQTLPAREFSAGLAEVVKYGLIRDEPFYRWLQENISKLLAREEAALAEAIERSCAIKADVVAADEREGGLRAILNLGHTFGHAIETHQGYGAWLHGEAVATGMLLALQLSARRNAIDAAEVEGFRELLQGMHLPVAPPADMTSADFLTLMARDKKVIDGRLRLVLLRGMGEALIVDDVDGEELTDLLEAAAGGT
jgi:3-dehydroquinate synthase